MLRPGEFLVTNRDAAEEGIGGELAYFARAAHVASDQDRTRAGSKGIFYISFLELAQGFHRDVINLPSSRHILGVEYLERERRHV